MSPTPVVHDASWDDEDWCPICGESHDDIEWSQWASPARHSPPPDEAERCPSISPTGERCGATISHFLPHRPPQSIDWASESADSRQDGATP